MKNNCVICSRTLGEGPLVEVVEVFVYAGTEEEVARRATDWRAHSSCVKKEEPNPGQGLLF